MHLPLTMCSFKGTKVKEGKRGPGSKWSKWSKCSANPTALIAYEVWLVTWQDSYDPMWNDWHFDSGSLTFPDLLVATYLLHCLLQQSLCSFSHAIIITLYYAYPCITYLTSVLNLYWICFCCYRYVSMRFASDFSYLKVLWELTGCAVGTAQWIHFRKTMMEWQSGPWRVSWTEGSTIKALMSTYSNGYVLFNLFDTCRS